jgi:hypothetical protein
MYHIKDAKSLGADGAGQKDPVEKTEDSGGKASDSEKESSGNQGMFFEKIGHDSSDAKGNYYKICKEKIW